MAVITVFVDGADRSLLVDRGSSMGYSRDINGQGTAGFVLGDVPTGFVPLHGHEVLIKEDGVDVFGGTIQTRPRQFAGADSAAALTLYKIDAASWEQRLSKRRVWRAYADVLFEDIVADLNTDFLTDEGITLSILAGSLITITFNGQSVAEAMDLLCSEETDGRTWYVTPAKVLTVNLSTATPAPATLNATNLKLSNPKPSIEPDDTGYANRITVVGGNPELVIMYTAEDLGEIAIRKTREGGSGIHWDTVEDPELVSAGQVQQRAEGILAQRKQLRQRFIGMTNVSGFDIGQEVLVELPNMDVTGPKAFFIIGIETQASPGVSELWHTITAVDGPFDGGWQSEYRRNIKRRTIPMQIEATPGLVRVEPEPGVLIHDPVPSEPEWFQAALSGTQTGESPLGIGITHQKSGKGGFVVQIARGPVAVPRQSHLELYPIDAADVAAVTPTVVLTWDELHLSSFKFTVLLSEDNTHAYVVERDAGSDPSFLVISLSAGFAGSVTATALGDNNNPTEGAVVGNYVFWPSTTDNKIFIFDVSVASTPVLDNVFDTTLGDVVTSCVPSSDGLFLYATGGTSDVVAIDISDPTAPSVTDTQVVSGNYESLDIDDEDARLIMFKRETGTTVRYALLGVAGGALTLTDEDTLSVTQTKMDGVSTLFFGDGAITFRERPVGGTDSYEAQIFTVVGSVVAFDKTFTYTHGASGHVGPSRSTIGKRSTVTYLFGTDNQITFGVAGFDEIVPYTIEGVLRTDFGGTGVDGELIQKGDLLVGVAPSAPYFLLPSSGAADGAYLRKRSAEASGMIWESGSGWSQVAIDDTDSPYTVARGVTVVLADTTAGAITVIYPAVAGELARLIIVKNDGTGGNDVTVDPPGSETIDGDLTRVLVDDEALGVTGSVNEWEVLFQNIPTVKLHADILRRVSLGL